MSLPFFTGQVPTAADFNALAVKADLATALASITAPLVTSVAGGWGPSP
jgi:hypothetical protein